jgi:hypothetical protein
LLLHACRGTEYPELEEADIRACFAFASELSRGGFVDLLVEQPA